MIDYLIEQDEQLFLYLNGLGAEQWDWFWITLSSKFSMIPFYLILVYVLYRTFGLQFWKPFLITLLVVFLCDRISVELFKEVFERLRPSHEDKFLGQIRLLEGKGGKFSFVSSHSTNVFGMSTWFVLLLRSRIPKIKWMYVWAALVAFSRIMVGKHYMLDIICGGILGCFIGYMVYQFWMFLNTKYNLITPRA